MFKTIFIWFKNSKNQFFINSLWVFVNGEDVNLHHFLLSLRNHIVYNYGKTQTYTNANGIYSYSLGIFGRIYPHEC